MLVPQSDKANLWRGRLTVLSLSYKHFLNYLLRRDLITLICINNCKINSNMNCSNLQEYLQHKNVQKMYIWSASSIINSFLMLKRDDVSTEPTQESCRPFNGTWKCQSLCVEMIDREVHCYPLVCYLIQCSNEQFSSKILFFMFGAKQISI